MLPWSFKLLFYEQSFFHALLRGFKLRMVPPSDCSEVEH
jgi:hypothetical protein